MMMRYRGLAETPRPTSWSPRLAFDAQIMHIVRVDSVSSRPDDKQSKGVALEALRAPLTGYFRRRVRQQDDVLDLVQEVFLRISSRGASDDIDNLKGYVFQVAASVLADRQRRRTVRHQEAHVEFDPERMGEPEIGPDRILAGREALNTALAALGRMPERTRTIFVLRRLEGMRYLEIAGRLGLSVSAVEKHMVRAVEHLAAIGDIR
jgi:RNA polymerase sigma-70 factor (ECF subfamily)